MVVGIGVDIIEIRRIKKSFTNKNFLNKCYTCKEQELFCKDNITNFHSLAGNFAAKEAVSKVLGCGFKNISLLDIEILREQSKKPYVILHNNAKNIGNTLGITNFFISISHDKTSAIAMAVGEKL